ncbi:MAG: hypothetical protein M3345_01250 [Actinomycetota bacterium]|nr:hypothetical protein [Actinomycetota bacterium]
MMWFWISLALQVVVGIMYLMSGLLAPIPAVAVLLLLWVGMTIILVRMRTAGPKTLVVPAAATLIWVATLWIGDLLLGWTA